jgi:4-hydroxy-tetrahydrodipicolinate synthase
MGSVAADLHVALAEAIWHSDLESARRVADRLFPLTQAFYRPGQDAHTRMKHALVRLGRMGNDLVRPPLRPNTDADRIIIDRALQESGLL